MAESWHSLVPEKIFEKLKSSDTGLSLSEAFERLKKDGPNTLPDRKPPSLLQLFLRQFQSPLIYILLAACVTVFVMGEVVDGSIILFVLLFNAVVGVVQEGKAENTLLALRKYVETNATVLRSGKEYIISDKEVVVGDIILLSEGEKVPADARVILSNNLKIDESSLTGESEPIIKTTDVIDTLELATAEQKNMIFRGTNVLSGNGQAIVVNTGTSTVIGQIAEQILSIDTEIPLKASIRYLSRTIIFAVVIISLTLFVAGVFLEHSAKEMFTTVVSLAVSVIPEGLPIVMTLVLATGVWRMSRRNALVKKLQAVEALGQARIIAVDKTGTITKNELIVRKVWLNEKMFDVSGEGYEPKGGVTLVGETVNLEKEKDLSFLGKLSALSSDARLSFSESEKSWKIAGDPTEAAMLVFGEKVGYHKDELIQNSPILSEIPFDYKLKYHAVVYKDGEDKILTVAGAPEVIVELCSNIRHEGKVRELSNKHKEELLNVFSKMSEEGLRVIAVASAKTTHSQVTAGAVHSLDFVGFFGMQDTIRPEVFDSMLKAKEAGIKVVMITGDYKITAQAIAKQAGIYTDGDEVLTGSEIDSLFEPELALRLDKVTVFARVTPDHKMHIINAYKRKGEIIAMTGDGVNDASSLVAADLGVAMGKIGTEVAKEAADIVLLDDNFGSIVSAIEEGRSIYKTIKKVILYLFSTSFGEVLTIGGAIFMGIPLPVLAPQIIWLNFVTDGFLDVSLAMEPKESNLLYGKFEKPKKYIVDSLMIKRMVLMSIPMMIGTLYLFSQYYEKDITKAWTVSLTLLAVFQWFNAWNCRSEKKSIFSSGFLANKYLVFATISIVVLHTFAVYAPVMNKLLHTTPLTFMEWMIIVPIGFSIVVVEEVRKYISRHS